MAKALGPHCICSLMTWQRCHKTHLLVGCTTWLLCHCRRAARLGTWQLRPAITRPPSCWESAADLWLLLRGGVPRAQCAAPAQAPAAPQRPPGRPYLTAAAAQIGPRPAAVKLPAHTSAALAGGSHWPSMMVAQERHPTTHPARLCTPKSLVWRARYAAALMSTCRLTTACLSYPLLSGLHKLHRCAAMHMLELTVATSPACSGLRGVQAHC